MCNEFLRQLTGKKVSVTAITDSNNWKECLESTRQVDDKRLRLDIASVKKSLQTNELSDVK